MSPCPQMKVFWRLINVPEKGRRSKAAYPRDPLPLCLPGVQLEGAPSFERFRDPFPAPPSPAWAPGVYLSGRPSSFLIQGSKERVWEPQPGGNKSQHAPSCWPGRRPTGRGPPRPAASRKEGAWIVGIAPQQL